MLKRLSAETTRAIDTMGERNCRILAWRHTQRLESLRLALEVNDEWRSRAWQTPDMAMCLGRYRD